ncbi:MAG: hypothetical protein RLZZ157_603 [Pseudomonadota bacterium]|jgi:hypothetical protein
MSAQWSRPAFHQGLECARQDLADVKLVQQPLPPLAEGEALLQLERFSLTANNVTYGTFGEAMAYWQFFPASAPDKGCVPVWGYARVVESLVPALALGTRVYGYFPMAQFLTVEPVKIGPQGFSDGRAHRQAMAPAYNRYDIAHESDADTQNRIALLRPLFVTGFLLDDWISAQKGWGACTIIASSASSKTALAMAACIKARGDMSVTALTSARSKPFVVATGFYDRVLTYDEIASLPDVASVYVDFAGDGGITRGVHEALGDALVQSIIVGGSHHKAQRLDTAGLIGPTPEFFFAPTHIGRLGQAWGAASFYQTVNDALMGFIAQSHHWLHVQEGQGLAHAQKVWAQLLANQIGPQDGAIIVV